MAKDQGKELRDDRFMLPKFRINYPCVCKRRAEDEEYDPGRFTFQAVFFPEETDLSKMEKIIEGYAKMAGLKKGWKSPLKGDDAYGEGVQVCNPKFYFKRGKPIVLWADKTPVENDEDIIPGSYGKSIVSFFAYDEKGNRGVGMSFESLQCLGGGKRFVGGASAAAQKRAEEEFEEEEYLDTAENDDEDDYGDA